MSEILTKQALANALLTLCEKQRFKKVSVAMLTTYCELNRQTFYYHFSDKYDLLAWTYYYNALHHLDEETTLENWTEHVTATLATMRQYKSFYRNTTQDDGEELTNSFAEVTTQLLLAMFERLDVENQISEENRLFYANFFSYGCCGVLIKWIRTDFTEEPATIAEKIDHLMKDIEIIAYHRYIATQ